MGAGNRTMQGIGLAIIIISLVVISASFGYGNSVQNKRITLADMMPNDIRQVPNNATLTSVASIISNQTLSSGQTHHVDIVLGAGLPHSVAQPFFPGSIVINPGDSVQWTNRDRVVHTVTSTYFDSGPIWPAESSQGSSSYTNKFSSSGIFSYYCKVHPYMSGTVYVGVQETQRQVVSTNHPGLTSIEIEMPQNAAYQNKYGPYFIPANAIVPSGSRVTWTNHDFIAHTATASGAEKLFDTSPILPSQSKSVIINGTGRVAYFCEIHPWMQGSLTIVSP